MVDEWKLPAYKPDNLASERSEQTGCELVGRVPKECDAVGTHNYWFDCVEAVPWRRPSRGPHCSGRAAGGNHKVSR